MKRKSNLLVFIIASLLMCLSSYAFAWPVNPIIVDTPEQDVLAYCPYPIYDELGNKPPFPDDEWVTSSWELTSLIACTGAPYDNPEIPNVLVTMTNMTNTAWGGYYNGEKTHVYYVADPETNLSNWDGLMGSNINGLQKAFIIDSIGVNKPLVYESMAYDDIFSPGETWKFIIQDYTNILGLAPSAFASLGIASDSQGDLVSSGSIVANAPEPATLMLLAAGLLGIRRKR